METLSYWERGSGEWSDCESLIMLGSQAWPTSYKSPPIAGKLQDQKNTVIEGTSYYH